MRRFKFGCLKNFFFLILFLTKLFALRLKNAEIEFCLLVLTRKVRMCRLNQMKNCIEEIYAKIKSVSFFSAANNIYRKVTYNSL